MKTHLVQIWTPRGAGSHVAWADVILSRDSVSGIPYKPLGTPRRITLPLTEVDSIRVGYAKFSAEVFSMISIVALFSALAVAFFALTHTTT
jgi:hypothetical protein